MKPLNKITKDFFHWQDQEKVMGPHSLLSGNCSDLYGDCSRLSGDCSDLSGNCSRLSGDCSRLSGNCSGLSGDCSRLSGNCSGLSGDFDAIPTAERDAHSEILFWVEGEA